MTTKIIKIELPDLSGLYEAAEEIRRGGLVAFPTETVYGLGANALDAEAVQSIFRAKGRPNDNPLIVHVADISMLEKLVTGIRPEARKLIAAYWPGPLTLIFYRAPIVPDEVTAGLDTVAVRMPDHPVALELIKKSNVPVAAPSANRSGRPSPTLACHVAEDLAGRIAYIIDGGPCRVGVESTVLDMTSEVPAILRPGGITPSMIEKVIGTVRLDEGVIGNNCTVKPKSPGMKYTHYAPKGEVIVVSGMPEDVVRWINQKIQQDEKECICSVVITSQEHLSQYGAKDALSFGSVHNPDEVAANIFRLFRECDHIGAEKIYIEAIPKEGIGLAVMNRIEKAAGGRIIQL